MNKKNVIRIIARIGYAAKCIVYCILGILTIYVAFSAASTEQVSKKSVFQEILTSPFGSVSLSAVILGFGCYVIWRLAQGMTNPDHLDMLKVKDVLMRIFYFFSAIAYASAAYIAFTVLTGDSEGQSDKKQQLGSSIMQETWGLALAAAIGIVIIVFAIIQFKHTFKGDFMDKFVSGMSQFEGQLANFLGRAGFAGRGIVYLMVGGFLISSSLTQNYEKAGGLTKAIDTLITQPFGPWLVGLIGLGLISFGVFCGFEGRYRKTS
ncbi:DUF1206 domain-containing protein [Aliiglaciecola litoralis]|uniref:DUF1206 domain-containing protein n=1 Tax=Aliiglaciecola litoralis TaxID=582857 RepID=A0ABN1LC33_9ALTE